MKQISTPDFKIEINFDQYYQPYYKVFRKGEPYTVKPEDYAKLSSIFNHLALLTQNAAEREARLAQQEAAVKADLVNMDVNQARRLLSDVGKRMWVDIQNTKTGGRCYTISPNGDIADVPMEGVWK